AKTPGTATDRDWFNAIAYSLKKCMTEHWMATTHEYYQQDRKRVYYLSLEFLMGKYFDKKFTQYGCL
ncbi:MAG: hypothetical protein KAI17_14325, partial [Thiotrichaceae bacterium]|nr:hypothetical protein [Thiotrichaceae bacterium]